jgi:hypothetical protein
VSSGIVREIGSGPLKLADECFALAKTMVKADVRSALTDMGNDYLDKAEKLKRA